VAGDIETLTALYDWATARGLPIRTLRAGDLEVHLDPLPPRQVLQVDSPSDPQAEARHSLETLLHSSGADPVALLRFGGPR